MDALLCRGKVIYTVPAYLKQYESKEQDNHGHFGRSIFFQPVMDVDHVSQPGGSSPGFFWIPAPVMAPCLLGPDGAHQHAEGDAGSPGIDQLIGHPYQPLRVVDFFFFDKIIECNQCCGTQNGVGEHINDDMRCKPGALQCRHQRLVVNIGPGDVYHDEDCGEQGGEGEDPFIVPPQIGEQPRHRQEESIPEPCFTHGTQGRPFEKVPQAGDEEGEDQQSGHCKQCRHGFVSALIGGGCPNCPEEQRRNRKIYE